MCAARDSKWDLCNERWDALFSRTHWWLKLNIQRKVEDCNRYRVLKLNLNREAVMIIIMVLIIIQVCQFGAALALRSKTFHVSQFWKMFFWLGSSCNIESKCKNLLKAVLTTLRKVTCAKKNYSWREILFLLLDRCTVKILRIKIKCNKHGVKHYFHTPYVENFFKKIPP